jgi:molybdate/tungstate transport system substrate-binding protein
VLRVLGRSRAAAGRLRAALALTAVLAAGALLAGCGGSAGSARKSAGNRLVVFGAGTLANPFAQEFAAFKRIDPRVQIASQFGGSVDMTKDLTELGERADVLGVADYSVIPKYMTSSAAKARASWYIGFVSNQITFAYTPHSKGADQLTASNWYRVLAQPGVRIGRSSPNSDPSGYQVIQMLELAARYYHDPGLVRAILKNSPASEEAQTETSLIAALQSGQIDYLGIYRSDALQRHFRYIHLPPALNLSDPALASLYRTVSVQTANGRVPGRPIIYALTIPSDAPNPALARRFVAFLLGPRGRAIMARNGFGVISPALASGMSKVPAALRGLVRPWGQGG